MIDVDDFIKHYSSLFPGTENSAPWKITDALSVIVNAMIVNLESGYVINGDIAIHKGAIIEQNVIMKGPVIIGNNCFIGANAYLRGPLFIDQSVRVGPGCEVKQSIIFSGSTIAHLNYVGNSIIGHNVNFEAGAVAANHYNERSAKSISVLFNGKVIDTNTDKFGALVGDDSKVGANAVLSPGTLLKPGSIVKRLELIDQLSR